MSNACPWMPLHARILAIRYSTHLKRTRRSNAAFIGHRPSPSGSIEGKQHLAGILTMRKNVPKSRCCLVMQVRRSPVVFRCQRVELNACLETVGFFSCQFLRYSADPIMFRPFAAYPRSC